MRIDVAFAALVAAAVLAWASDPAHAAPKCTLSRIAEWPVRPGTGQPVVDGTINGQKVGVLLDTGATTTMLLRPATARLGLVRYDARGNRVIAIGGETGAESVLVDEFAIGPAVRKNVRLLVAGEYDFGGDVAVILGEDFFRQLEVEFDLPHDAVRIFQARDCEGTSLAYWSPGGTAEADLETDSTSNPQIGVRVEINGRRFLAQLDSGAHRSVLTQSAAESLGVTPEAKGVVSAGCFMGVGDKVIETWIGPFDSFRIGDEVIRDPQLHFADVWRYSKFVEVGSRLPRATVHADLLLGADFLRAHRVLVAHGQRKLYFAYVGGTVFPAEASRPCEKGVRRNAEPKADARGN